MKSSVENKKYSKIRYIFTHVQRHEKSARSVINDDWRFVVDQYKVAGNSFLKKDYKTAGQAAALGTGLGALATPKTVKANFWEPLLIGLRALSDQR